MKKNLLSALSGVFLSILLVNAGVAWAFENCLDDDGGTEQVQHVESGVNPRAAAQPPVAVLPISNIPTARIHCVESHFQFRLSAEVGYVASLKTARERVLLNHFLPIGSLKSREGLAAQGSVFGHVFDFTPPSVSRHIILSILRV